MDPTILHPPSFAVPEQRAASRSPSRSPNRRHHFIAHELDPLLSDLSPSATLKILQTTDSVLDGAPRKGAFIDGVAAASTSERAWGIKAALAGKKVREWYKELTVWPWPTSASADSRNGFGPSVSDARSPESQRAADQKGHAPISSTILSKNETSCWESLSAQTVQQHEARVEEIRDDMETLELDELKEHVRATHVPLTSRRSVYGHSDGNLSTGYAHLDDFTAVITATIMQALPDVSRLNSLLGVWSARLVVLRQVPDFLHCMERTDAAMNSAWKVIEKQRSEQTSSDSDLNREAFVTMQLILEGQILELGQRLDSMLDALEGREDTVPDVWIDRMEAVEANFGTWVVETEKQVLENELSSLATSVSVPAAVRHEERIESLTPRSPLDSKNDTTEAFHSEGEGNQTGATGHEEVEKSSQLRSQWKTPANSRLPDGRFSDPTTPSRTGSNESGEISSHLKKLLDSREASAEKTGSPFAFSPTPSMRQPHVDLPSNGCLEPLLSHDDMKRVGAEEKGVRSRSNSKPIPLDLSKTDSNFESNIRSDFSSDASYPGSATSDYSSNMSSPEIQHASRAEYFGAPVEVTSPSCSQRDPASPMDTISRHSSQRTERGRPLSEDFAARDFASPVGARSRASSFIPEDVIFGEKNTGEPQVFKKSPHRFEEVADAAPGVTPVKIRKQRKPNTTSPSKPSSQHSSPTKSGSEQLEARISSILTEIPAHIRLTSGPGAEAEEILHPGFTPIDTQSPAAGQTPPRFTRAQTSVGSPSITLAPAQAKNYKHRPGGDAEIQLYHLHQAGKDVAIKLFVRLVGEAGERVMVRIGGGWADLGEYLKEYATHHGKRSVSDSRYAIQGLPSSPAASSPAVGSAGYSASNSRPTSSSGLDGPTMPMTPGHAEPRYFQATSGSNPAVNALRPGSRSSEEDSPLGGAGANMKKVDISPSKQAWVDGMMDQARKAGAEKNTAGADVGDLGTVGGTKRVFLRSKTTA